MHIYVGVHCLSSRYLTRRVSSHVPFGASLLSTYCTPPAMFVCTNGGGDGVLSSCCCLDRPSLCCI